MEPNRSLSGIDADPEAAVAELEWLLTALKENNSHIRRIDHVESCDVDDVSTETLTIEYTLTREFDGIDPIDYPEEE